MEVHVDDLNNSMDKTEHIPVTTFLSFTFDNADNKIEIDLKVGRQLHLGVITSSIPIYTYV